MLSNENFKLSNREIIEKGSRVLIKELGYSGFLRYIRNFEDGSGEDYIKVQDDIYRDMSLNEVFDNANSNWQEINSK